MEEGADILDLEVYVESLNNSFEHIRIMAKEVDERFSNS